MLFFCPDCLAYNCKRCFPESCWNVKLHCPFSNKIHRDKDLFLDFEKLAID